MITTMNIRQISLLRQRMAIDRRISISRKKAKSHIQICTIIHIIRILMYLKRKENVKTTYLLDKDDGDLQVATLRGHIWLPMN